MPAGSSRITGVTVFDIDASVFPTFPSSVLAGEDRADYNRPIPVRTRRTPDET